MNYLLPTTAEIDGIEYKIRSDYRCILDIFSALNDVNLSNEEKAIVILCVFYEESEKIPRDKVQEAIKECFKFINCGNEEPKKKTQKLVDWDKDFQYIVAPINRVVGKDIRGETYLHWWTFMSAYYEIGGECVFSQIVRIRNKKAQGKQLDKTEQEWYKDNREIVDIGTKYTDEDDKFFAELIGGK